MSVKKKTSAIVETADESFDDGMATFTAPDGKILIVAKETETYDRLIQLKWEMV
jgi:hypothetical protein